MIHNPKLSFLDMYYIHALPNFRKGNNDDFEFIFTFGYGGLIMMFIMFIPMTLACFDIYIYNNLFLIFCCFMTIYINYYIYIRKKRIYYLETIKEEVILIKSKKVFWIISTIFILLFISFVVLGLYGVMT